MFTDIVGSTQLLSELGDRYGDALAEHRAIARGVFGRHSGVEVDTQGDAFFVAYERASDALAAAAEVHVELEAASVGRVRIGLHTGEPVLTDEGYVGMDVHRAARIAAAGHAGQTLVSAHTRELVAESHLLDLGVHRLKDVGDVRLFQVGDEQFPPVRAIASTNLSAPSHRLIGREQEHVELHDLVVREGARLVTVTGIGGIGKTTLAKAVANTVRERFPDGVWFVDLASVADPGLVESSVSAALGNPPSVDEFLRGRETLLVLDNFEQVLEAAPKLAGWLDACPSLVIVATSRERLRLQAEREYPLAPLGEASAVELFEDRARSVAPGFRGDPVELRALCERLDGLPLALELAAARIKMLTPAQLLDRLDERLPVLTGGSRDLPQRQQTIEATIAWSYDLLEPGERELFAQLAVFSGGWTLGAAEIVCQASLDRLQALVDKSLVQFEQGRFGMLETIREYAQKQLADLAGGALVHRRHAEHFADLVSRAEPALTGSEQERWLEELDVEYENCRAVMQWSLHHTESIDFGLRVAAGLSFFWYLRSLQKEGLQWLEPTLAAAADVDSPELLRALWGAGFFLTLFDDTRGMSYLERGLEKAEAIGDGSMVARFQMILGLHAFFTNDLSAARYHLEQSIALARSADDQWCLSDALGTLGSIYPLIGHIDEGRRVAGEGLELATRRGDLNCMRMALFGLALAERRAGNVSSARAMANEGLEISRRLGDLFFSSYCLWILATSERELGNRDASRVAADEALLHARQVGAPLLVVCALEARAGVAVDDSDDTEARALLEQAITLEGQSIVPGSYRSEALRALGELEAAHGETETATRHLNAALIIAQQVPDPWAEDRARRTLYDVMR